MKEFTSCVAVLGDQVASRHSDREDTYQYILEATDTTNRRVPPLDPLRVTVGDEVQGIYATLGEALAATLCFRESLIGQAEFRFGLGGGEVQIIDADRGIQDGSAWWRAREAVEWVESAAQDPGLSTLRTHIIDARGETNPLTEPLIQLVDAHLGRLREGSLESLRSLRSGLDNKAAAALAGISPSANSQRINNNDLRVLAAAMATLTTLP